MIVDNNILFSLMKPDSTASAIFKSASDFEAPEFVKTELEEHEGECMRKSGLTRKEFEKRKAEVFSRISLVPVEAYKQFLEEALNAVSDRDDAPYVALALARKRPIWSNDSGLKKLQCVVVLTTEDVIKLRE